MDNDDEVSEQSSSSLAMGEYFGQSKPKDASEIFAPGIVSTYEDEVEASFGPEGNEIYFTIRELRRRISIRKSVMVNGVWSDPVELSFQRDNYSYYSPTITADNNYLFFSSNMPENASDTIHDWNFWYCINENGEWSDPIWCDFNTEKDELSITIAESGMIYFSFNYDPEYNNQIYQTKFKEGKFLPVKKLKGDLNTEFGEVHPCVAPDESYILIASDSKDGFGMLDIYVSFRKADGSWSKAYNLGEKVNSNRFEINPSISADGRYLFFSSYTMKLYPESKQYDNKYLNGSGNIYWINTDIIKSIKEEYS